MPGVQRAAFLASALVCMLALAGPRAHASEWSPPVSGGAVILGFGDAYPGGTHRGVDVRADAGCAVAAPTGGTVSFAGQIPADGGGTCGAVTIELPDGRRMSLLPLEGVVVVTGERIEAGRSIGRVASAGDDSSACAHLHVSVRSGDLYLDPGVLTTAAVASEPYAPADTVAPLGVTGSSGDGVSAEVAAPTAAPASSATASTAPAQVGVEIPTAGAEASVAPAAVNRLAGARSAGLPTPSALRPARRPAAPNPASTIAPVSQRALASTGLACGMAAAALGIGLSRRAVPVRVR